MKQNQLKKVTLSIKDLLFRYRENKTINENRKVMNRRIPCYIKKSINTEKSPQYDNTSFQKAIKYYTLKSDNKTIHAEDLSNYFRPIRNILRVKNIRKKTINNINKNNSFLNNNNRGNSYKTNRNLRQKIYINLFKNENQDMKFMETFNHKNNDINNSFLKNSYFNKNTLQTDRTNKISIFPFNIRKNKINKAIKIINININTNNKNISEITSLNNNNSKNISDYETQISLNNIINNSKNKDKDKIIELNSKTLYQFRPRKINLPKNGINLSSMQSKNKILQNILNRRKNTNKRKI